MNPVSPSGELQQPDLFQASAGGGEPQPRPVDGGDLAELAATCAGCRRCGLVLGRQQVVVSRGNPAARLMVIGEGPGAQEDAQGLPFVGRAGQLLDQMLASVGIDSNRDAYMCNVVKCRPPDNRKPTAEEMAACTPWLERQIQLVDPPVILLAGATAMEGVLGVKGGITRLRGQWRQGSGAVLGGRWLLPIFHPSYLLRNPSRQQGSPKWLTWQDLQDVRRRLDQLAGGGVPAGPAEDPSLPSGL
ncbi:MAG: uracil-DNA glycosylase [Synechococcus sp.]|nr:uracil-DNA glycosylase [Synechococcus sp.]